MKLPKKNFFLYFAKLNLLIFLPFLIFFYFILEGINLPYVGPNAGNFIVYSNIAHNYNTFGYLQTKFASVISISNTLPQNPEFFLHHPPLLSIILSIFLKIFGEDFWVGRITMIIFAFGTIYLTYLLSKNYLVNKYVFVPILVMSLVPASTIFGKMIGQETLVLFFIMLALFFSLKYLKSNNNFFYILTLASIILGTLSDWPMAIFSMALIPLYIKYKKGKEGFAVALASIAITLLLFIWIVLVGPGFYDLKGAFSVRSFVGLSNIPMWPILWLGSTILRLLIYFNPVFVLFSFVALHTSFKNIRKGKYSDLDIVIIIFFIFGITHLALYTQASFTHPYLNYYMLPFVTFATSLIITKLFANKGFMILSLVITFSALYLITITQSKNEQIYSNIWRYKMVDAASKFLSPYETIISNRYYGVDLDLWKYPFLINTKILGEKNQQNQLLKYSHYVYSCLRSCYEYKNELEILKKRYKHVRILSGKAEMFVFFLKEKGGKKIQNDIVIEESAIKESYILSLYRKIRNLLNVPQI